MTPMLESLSAAVSDRSLVVGTVGLGYVGLPVACSFARVGFNVVGVDVDSQRVDDVNHGHSPIRGEPGLNALLEDVVKSGRLTATRNYEDLGAARIITLNVQTPVGSDQRPDYAALEAACNSLGRVMGAGTLVIVESTVSPGTSAGLVTRILAEGSGLEPEVEFYVGACPERVMPGKLLSNLELVPRVVGASSSAIAKVMRSFYETVVSAEIDLADTTTAEMVKVVENTYRDVQIAFANEVALVCADLRLDVWEVRSLVNKVPFRDMHLPGGGVGGHCIPKDPWLLAASATQPLTLIPAARGVNDSMPIRVADLVIRASRAMSKNPPAGRDPKRVVVFGYSYLPGSDDVRNSPSRTLIETLEAGGLTAAAHDPHVPGMDSDLSDAATECAIGVMMVPHPAYTDRLPELPLLIDARHLTLALQAIESLERAPDA